VTDQGNLFALVKFYRAAQSRGLKPLVGVDALVREEGERAEPSHSCCVPERAGLPQPDPARDAFVSRRPGPPRPDVAARVAGRRHHGGLIALSGAREGDVGRALLAGRDDEAGRALEAWLALFGDRYYLELQRTGRPGDEECIAGQLRLAVSRGVPVVRDQRRAFHFP